MVSLKIGLLNCFFFFFSHDTSLILHQPLYMCTHNYTGVLDRNNGENLKLFIEES